VDNGWIELNPDYADSDSKNKHKYVVKCNRNFVVNSIANFVVKKSINYKHERRSSKKKKSRVVWMPVDDLLIKSLPICASKF
jgi:hypothetical protein